MMKEGQATRWQHVSFIWHLTMTNSAWASHPFLSDSTCSPFAWDLEGYEARSNRQPLGLNTRWLRQTTMNRNEYDSLQGLTACICYLSPSQCPGVHAFVIICSCSFSVTGCNKCLQELTPKRWEAMGGKFLKLKLATSIWVYLHIEMHNDSA